MSLHNVTFSREKFCRIPLVLSLALVQVRSPRAEGSVPCGSRRVSRDLGGRFGGAVAAAASASRPPPVAHHPRRASQQQPSRQPLCALSVSVPVDNCVRVRRQCSTQSDNRLPYHPTGRTHSSPSRSVTKLCLLHTKNQARVTHNSIVFCERAFLALIFRDTWISMPAT
jgi:hypothetical protein